MNTKLDIYCVIPGWRKIVEGKGEEKQSLLLKANTAFGPISEPIQ